MTLNTITPSRRTSHGARRVGVALAALALTLALALALGARDAGAQPISPQLVGGGFPALTLTYTDAQGPGTVTITPQGPDPFSGGTAIVVTLVQNGIAYTGGGFVRPGELGGFVVDFTIAGPYGDSYHLSGTLIRDADGARWRGMGRWWAVWNRAITDEWFMAGGPFAEPAPRPQLSTRVRLNPTAGSRVSGAVTLTALPEGETRYELQLSGLLPGKAYSIRLHAGTPARPSASFSQIVSVNADAFGRAGATGLVRFRGTEGIPLLEIADGNHVITVVGFGQTVAVGSIPFLQPLG